MTSQLFVLFSIVLISLANMAMSDENCKCGGHYANRRPVRGCVQDTCVAKTSDSVRCVTINRATQVNVTIGYDCVPWPKNSPTDCAIFDDGSRLCVNDACQLIPNANGPKTDSCQMNPDQAHATVGALFTAQGLNFGFEAVRKIALDEIMKLQIPTQTLVASGFNITVSNIKVEKFVPPALSYALEPPATAKIIAKGGDFKVCASFKAFWQVAPFVAASGDLCAWSANAKGVDAEVQIKTSVTQDGRIHLETGTCSFNAPIETRITGIVGTMVQAVTNLLQSTIQKKAGAEFCKVIGDAVRATVNTLLKELPTEFKVDARYGINYTVRSISMTDYGVKAQAAINVNFDSKRKRISA